MQNQAPTKTMLNIYLNFNGNCKEAINFYHSILDGEITQQMTFGEGPMDSTPETKDLIMHTEFNFDGCQILASDTPPQHEFKMGTNYNLSLYFPTKERASEVYQKLGEGGTATMPFNEVFWGGHFGMLVDKFGVNWMVSCP